MDKHTALLQLRDAKSAMLHWREYARQHLSSGASIGSKGAPSAKPNEYIFGKWFHGEGSDLLGHLPEFCAIRESHSTLHGIHAQIHHHLLSDEVEYAKQQWKHFTDTFHRMLDAIIALEQHLEHQLKLQAIS
jgi:hypothetical protein